MRGRGESSRNGIAAGRADDRVVADERPVAARHGAVLLVEALLHVDAVRDAVAVGEDQRRAVVGLGLAEGGQGLLGIGTHRDARDVDAAVRDRLEREVLLGDGLAGRGELGDRAERGRLRHLAARVRVDLGVEHEDVHVAAAGQDVVEPARADVVRPAVAADDPDAAPDQVVDHAEQVDDSRLVPAVEPPPQLDQPLALRAQLRLAQLRRTQDLVDQLAADHLAQLGQATAGQLGVPVGGEAEAETELGVVLEQGVRPGRAAPVGVGRPGRGRQVAAVDRRAARRVGDHQPVAEQLRQELHVGRLAAPGAGARELEERLEELAAAHRAEIDPRPVVHRQRLEEGDVLRARPRPAARAAPG